MSKRRFHVRFRMRTAVAAFTLALPTLMSAAPSSADEAVAASTETIQQTAANANLFRAQRGLAEYENTKIVNIAQVESYCEPLRHLRPPFANARHFLVLGKCEFLLGHYMEAKQAWENAQRDQLPALITKEDFEKAFRLDCGMSMSGDCTSAAVGRSAEEMAAVREKRVDAMKKAKEALEGTNPLYPVSRAPRISFSVVDGSTGQLVTPDLFVVSGQKADYQVFAAPGGVMMNRSSIIVDVSAPDFERSQSTYDLEDGQARQGVIRLTRIRRAPPQPPEPPVKLETSSLPVILMGVGGALLTAGAIMGLDYMDTVNDTRSQCSRNECPSAAEPHGFHDFENIGSPLFIGLGALGVLSGAAIAVEPTLIGGPAGPAPQTTIQTVKVGVVGCF